MTGTDPFQKFSLIFERQQIEGHAFAAVDDFLCGEGVFGFVVIENELAVTNLVGLIHDVSVSG